MTLQDQQARAQEELGHAVNEFHLASLITADRNLGFEKTEENKAVFVEKMLGIIARVRTETIDAVEAAMPVKQDESSLLSAESVQGEKAKGAQNKEVGIYKGWNMYREDMLAHLRALRDLKANV